MISTLHQAQKERSHIDLGRQRPFLADIKKNASSPRLWLLFGTTQGDNAQLLNLAQSLGWPFEVKGEVDGVPMTIVDRLCSSAGLTLRRQKRLSASLLWPDVLLIAGGRRVTDAVRIRAMSSGRSRIVCIGRPWAPLDLFDLVITTPQYRLPNLPNVLQNTMPLNRPSDEALNLAAAEWQDAFRHLPRPWTAVIVGGNSGSCHFGHDSAVRLAEDANALAKRRSGSLLISTSSRTSKSVADRLIEDIDVPHLAYRWDQTGRSNPYLGFLALADNFIVTSDSASMAAEAIATGKPVTLFDVPLRARTRFLTGRPESRRWRRLRDDLTRRGLWVPSRDMMVYQRQLRAEGYLRPMDQLDKPFKPKAPGDLQRAIAAVQALFPRFRSAQEFVEKGEPHGLVSAG